MNITTENYEEIIGELAAAKMWFTEHGKNTNTAIVGICDRAINYITRQKATINRLKKYDEERDIRLHARLTESAKVEAIEEFLENAIDKAVCRAHGDGTERLYVEVASLREIAKELKGERSREGGLRK